MWRQLWVRAGLFPLPMLLLLQVFSCLDLPSLRPNYPVVECLVMCLSAAACLTEFPAWSATRFCMNRFDRALTLFIGDRAIRAIFPGCGSCVGLAHPLFSWLIYMAARKYFARNRAGGFEVMRFSVLGCFVLYALSWARGLREGQVTADLLLPNKSVFSILLAAQIAWMLPAVAVNDKKFRGVKRVLTKCGLLWLLCLLATTGGRAGWLGLCAAGFYLKAVARHGKVRRSSISMAALVFLLLFGLLLFYKSGSTEGRWLIFKVTGKMIGDHWMLGVGTCQFAVHYLEYQESYFQSRSLDSKEALRAGNTCYAFNELLQLQAEGGIFAMVLFIFAAITFFHRAGEAFTNSAPFAIGAKACLLCLLVGSLLSYNLHGSCTSTLFLFWLAFLNTNAAQPDRVQKKRCVNLEGFVAALVGALLLTHFIFLWAFRKESRQAGLLSRAGFKQKALEKYRPLARSYIHDGETDYLFAKELALNGKTAEAIAAMKELTRGYASDEVYRFAAQLAESLGQPGEAERYFKKAVYSVPSRMTNRFALFFHYLDVRDTIHAMFWGRSILAMPVKIPSQKTEGMLRDVKVLLGKLRKVSYSNKDTMS